MPANSVLCAILFVIILGKLNYVTRGVRFILNNNAHNTHNKFENKF